MSKISCNCLRTLDLYAQTKLPGTGQEVWFFCVIHSKSSHPFFCVSPRFMILWLRTKKRETSPVNCLFKPPSVKKKLYLDQFVNLFEVLNELKSNVWMETDDNFHFWKKMLQIGTSNWKGSWLHSRKWSNKCDKKAYTKNTTWSYTSYWWRTNLRLLVQHDTYHPHFAT